MLTRPAAILFDLDGTLTDRRRSMEAFADRFATHFANSLRSPAGGVALRLNVHDTLVAADGWGWTPRRAFFAELMRRLPWSTPVSLHAVRAFWALHFAECTQPAEGLHDTFRALRVHGVRLGVVSNGRGEMQQRKIDVLGIRGELDGVVISGDVRVEKPDPQIFGHASDAMRVAPGACWFVGDHPLHDVAGASACGMSSVWLDHGQPWPASQPSPGRRIEKLADLVHMLG